VQSPTWRSPQSRFKSLSRSSKAPTTPRFVGALFYDAAPVRPRCGQVAAGETRRPGQGFRSVPGHVREEVQRRKAMVTASSAAAEIHSQREGCILRGLASRERLSSTLIWTLLATAPEDGPCVPRRTTDAPLRYLEAILAVR